MLPFHFSSITQRAASMGKQSYVILMFRKAIVSTKQTESLQRPRFVASQVCLQFGLSDLYATFLLHVCGTVIIFIIIIIIIIFFFFFLFFFFFFKLNQIVVLTVRYFPLRGFCDQNYLLC